MSYKLQLTNLQNVAPGNVATLKLPTGKGAPTIDQIKLALTGGMLPSHIEWLRLKANGRIFFDEGTGSEIADRDDYRGVFSENGYVVVDFTEPNARNGASEQLLASVPASLLQDLTCEIKIAAGAPGGGRIAATMNYRPPTNNPYILKRLATTQDFSSAGSAGAPNIMYLPTGQSGGKIKRVWIKETTPGNILAAELRIANNVVTTTTRANAENDQKRNKLVPQSGWFVLDFVEDGNLAGILDTATAPEAELRLETTAGEQIKVYYDFIDPINRL
jgi:hypothetical protein